MRFDRIQAIDVAQPFVARLFGLAELRMDVAGGGGSDGRLSYLMLADARRLRATLIATASGLTQESMHPETMEAPQQALLTVPTKRLLGATLLSSTFLASAGGLIWLACPPACSTTTSDWSRAFRCCSVWCSRSGSR